MGWISGSGCAVVFGAVIGLALPGKTTYFVGHSDKTVNITFESKADAETIVGNSHEATGQVDVDDKGGSVSITVPVASMKTGIDKRDEHLRSGMWLDASKNPSISFKSKKVEATKEKGKFKVTGEFSMHGVSKEMVVTVEEKEVSEEAAQKAELPKGKWLSFVTDFSVKLSDYGVKIPKQSISKVSDTWTVKMSLFAGTAKLEKK